MGLHPSICRFWHPVPKSSESDQNTGPVGSESILKPAQGAYVHPQSLQASKSHPVLAYKKGVGTTALGQPFMKPGACALSLSHKGCKIVLFQKDFGHSKEQT